MNANDFAIYQEGIYKLSNFEEFNPYASVRDIRILSDHFDPIIYLPALLVKIFGPSPYLLLTFEWFMWIYFSYILYKLGNFDWKSVRWIKILSLIIFSKSILYAVAFPIHPSTWSIIPITFLVYYIDKNNSKGIFFSALSLILFKELFIFMITGLSFYYLMKKNLKLFLSLLLLGSVSYILIFKIRIMIYGQSIDYGHALITNFLASPLTYLWKQFQAMDFPYSMIVPPLLLINKNNYKKFIPLLFFILPGFAIHLLGGRLARHHSIALISCILVMGIFKTNPKAIIILIFLATGTSRYERAVKNLFGIKIKNCTISTEKLVSIKKIQDIIQPLKDDKTVLASGSIITLIVSPTNKVLQLENFTLPRKSYDYLVMEKNGSGNVAPVSPQTIDAIVTRCRPFMSKNLFEDEYFIVMKGPIPQSCVNLKSFTNFEIGFRSQMNEKD